MTKAVTTSRRSARRYVPLRPGSRFPEVYRTGTRTRLPGVTVIEARGFGDMPEIGVVAGKGVGNAVRRNLAKRRLRAAAQQVSWRPNMAYALVASAETLDVAFDELVAHLRQVVTETHGTVSGSTPDNVGKRR